MMKKMSVLFVALLATLGAQAAERTIELPAPAADGGKTLVKALWERHSTREFSTRELTLTELSGLLWAANGINRPESGKRTAPSAQDKRDIDVYVLRADGAYCYDAAKNCLHLVAEGDHRALVAGGQRSVLTAPVMLVLVSDLSRFGGRDAARDRMVGALDAGIVSQNISLYCTATGLATVPRASMDADGLRRVLKLTDGQVLLMNHPVGYAK